MKAFLNDWRGSPRKMNIVLKAVRGLGAIDSADRLQFLVSPYAEALRKLVLSAVANASNNASINPRDLVISEATVGRGTFLKRVHFKGRGRTGRVTRPSCNVMVVLKEKESGK
jgi:large subunit ribosomal protein L22